MRDYQSVRQEVFAGLTIVCAMGYIVIAVPMVLAAAGVPPTAALFGACVLTGVATLAVGVVGGSPVVIAPAIGMLILFKEFVLPRTGGQEHAWQSGLFAVAIAGVALWLLSLDLGRLTFGSKGVAPSSLDNPRTGREKILFRLPAAVRAAVVASIGALLATFAFDIARGNAPLFAEYESATGMGAYSAESRMWAFAIVVLLIAASDVYFNRRLQNTVASLEAAARPTAATLARIGVLASELAPALSVAAMSWLFHPTQAISSGEAELFLWSNKEQIDAAIEAIRQDNILEIIAFSALLLSVLLSDFAGSPYDILRHESYTRHAGAFVDESKREKRIIRSLRVDSTLNLAAPFFGLSPIVYYAESWAGQYNKGKSGLTAIVAATPFLLLAIWIAVSVLVLGISPQGILSAVPPIAIAPVLFYVGLIITTASFSIAQSGTTEADQEDVDFKPAAFATIVTGVTSDVSVGMLAGLVVYMLAVGLRGAASPDSVKWLAGLILLSKLLDVIV